MMSRLYISETDSFFYSDLNDTFSFRMEKNDINNLFGTISVNGFFNMESSYLPERSVADDIFFIITIQTNAESKTIQASGYCRDNCSGHSWPAGLSVIIDTLNNYITAYKNKINSGYLFIQSKAMLDAWPFGDKIKLADHLNEHVAANEDIFNRFKSLYQQGKEVQYYEGTWIYRITASGGYEFTYSDLDTFYISIHDRSKAIDWLLNLKLSRIPDKGIYVSGSNYQWINEKIEKARYPVLFIDGPLQSGEYVYSVSLMRGD